MLLAAGMKELGAAARYPQAGSAITSTGINITTAPIAKTQGRGDKAAVAAVVIRGGHPP